MVTFTKRFMANRTRWRFLHVPTGLYWTKKHEDVKGIWKIWSNLGKFGHSFKMKPDSRKIVMYYHPDDQYNNKSYSPKRVSKPGEWVAVEGYWNEAARPHREYPELK